MKLFFEKKISPEGNFPLQSFDVTWIKFGNNLGRLLRKVVFMYSRTTTEDRAFVSLFSFETTVCHKITQKNHKKQHKNVKLSWVLWVLSRYFSYMKTENVQQLFTKCMKNDKLECFGFAVNLRHIFNEKLLSALQNAYWTTNVVVVEGFRSFNPKTVRKVHKNCV